MPITTTFSSLSTRAFSSNKKSLNGVKPYVAVLNKTTNYAEVYINTDTNFQDTIYIDWGDGQIDQSSSFNTPKAYGHNYATLGQKTISILSTSGKIAIRNDRETTDVTKWGNQKFISTNSMFANCTKLNSFPTTETPNLSICQDATLMFSNSSINSSTINNWDMSNVTNMASMFLNCKSFNQLLNNWNVGNVTNMSSMFYGAIYFSQPLNLWNTINVTDMSYMFGTNLAPMTGFVDAPNSPLRHNFNQNIGMWNTSKVTNMQGMFQASEFNQPLNSWNTGNVTNMSYMFSQARKFNQPLNLWNTINVTNMSSMFNNSLVFNQNISGWNTGNVTNMSGMFSTVTSFNQPIGSWNTIKVTNMSYMFDASTAFNQPLNSWNVGNVTNMSSMFSTATGFNNVAVPTLFNQPLNSWNVGKVTNMDNMFAYSTAFNQNLTSWITGLTVQPNTFSYLANATWRASKATSYPFLKNGVTRVNT